MQEILFSWVGTLGGFVGVGIAFLTYRKATKKDREAKAEALKAKIEKEALLYDSVDWLKQQFGKKPNGGGIMEQLSDFMAETRLEFVHVKENQQIIALDVREVKTLQSEHTRSHERLG